LPEVDEKVYSRSRVSARIGRTIREDLALRIIELLGEKAGNAPLVIEDRLLLLALAQTSPLSSP
jgi:hypothetical protein